MPESDHPTYRPIERFWPYADLPEQPTDEELAALSPELREALFGAPPHPFSLSVVFPPLEAAADAAAAARHARAVELARASDEFCETGEGEARRYRARFYPGDRPLRLRELYELVEALPDTEVLIDDRPVPYARELWLPLVWCLIR